MTFGNQKGRIELCPKTRVLAGVYDGHVIDYASGAGFRKFSRGWAHGVWHRGQKNGEPLAEDITTFKRDVFVAACLEPAIAAFLSNHPELRA